MVYRSLALTSNPADVWHRVAEEVRPGRKAARTQRLALDALEQGLLVAVLQATQGRPLLSRLAQSATRVILNHRLEPDSPQGHYSVLGATDSDTLTLHDPHLGPHRRLNWSQFKALWSSPPAASEITGHVLLAIGRQPHRRNCTACGTVLPVSVACRRCAKPIDIGPQAAIGCSRVDCPQRLWHRLFCPHCDWATTTL